MQYFITVITKQMHNGRSASAIHYFACFAVLLGMAYSSGCNVTCKRPDAVFVQASAGSDGALRVWNSATSGIEKLLPNKFDKAVTKYQPPPPSLCHCLNRCPGIRLHDSLQRAFVTPLPGGE